jgi:beta-galactosidase
LPKYAFYFYQSQYRKPLAEKSDFGKPMVFIANNWNNPATKAITVFSNCDEVELLLNGKIIARQKPDNDALSNKLAHPPFTFKIDKFEPGILIAKGYARGQLVVASHQQTPAKPSQLKLDIDYSGKTIRTGRQPDIVFVYAKITDANGTLITDADNIVTFTVTGNAALIGANPVKVEGGIATILLKTSSSSGTFAITASSGSLQKGQIKVVPNSGK